MKQTKCVNGEIVELTDADLKEIEERTKRSIEEAKTLYKEKRRFAYPEIGDQLDDLFRQGAFSEEMSDKLQQVKTDHPKPE